MCFERVATWRDPFSLVTWLLDAVLSPNAAQPNEQTSLTPRVRRCVSWGTKWLLIANCRNSPNIRLWKLALEIKRPQAVKYDQLVVVFV